MTRGNDGATVEVRTMSPFIRNSILPSALASPSQNLLDPQAPAGRGKRGQRREGRGIRFSGEEQAISSMSPPAGGNGSCRRWMEEGEVW